MVLLTPAVAMSASNSGHTSIQQQVWVNSGSVTIRPGTDALKLLEILGGTTGSFSPTK
jgi:hypothetical protein